MAEVDCSGSSWSSSERVTAGAAVDAAIAGVGVTRLISHQVAEAVACGALQIILAQYEPATMPVSMLHAGQEILPLKVRSFLDFAAPRLRAAMAAERLNPDREAQ